MKLPRLLLLALASLFCLSSVATPVYLSSDTIRERKAVPDSVKKSNEIPDTLSSSVNLREISVTHETVKRRGNQELVTITKQMREGTTNAFQLLGKLQGFHSDFNGKELEYMGSKKIVFLVDSIPSQAANMYNPARFDKIDIVYNPEGEYSGYDVLINLRTRPHYIGAEMSASSGISYFPREGAIGKSDGIGRQSESLFMSYTRDKFNYYAFGTFQYGAGASNTYEKSEYTKNNYLYQSLPAKKGDPQYVSDWRYVKAGGAVDWQPVNGTSASLSYDFASDNIHRRTHGSLEAGEIDGSRRLAETFRSRSGQRGASVHTVGLHFRSKFGQWNASAKAGAVINKKESYSELSRSSGYHMIDNRNIDLNTISWNASAGRPGADGKIYYNFNYSGMWYEFTSRRNGSGELLARDYTRRQQATAQITYYPDRKLSMGGGAGGIYVNNTYTHSRLNPYVWGWIHYQPSSKFWARLNYTLSFRNPANFVREAYGQFADSLMYSSGNPELHSFAGHSYLLQSGFLKMFTLVSNLLIEPQEYSQVYGEGYGLRPDGITGPYATRIWQSIDSKYWNTRLNFSKRISKFDVSAFVSMSKFWSKYKDFKNSDTGYSFGGDVTRFWNSIGFRAQISYQNYDTRSGSVQSTTFARKDLLMFSVAKWLLKNRLTISLTYISPIHFTSDIAKSYTISPAFRQTTWGGNNWRNDNGLSLDIKLMLYKGKQVRKYDRSIEAGN